jgi:hypothetical protein
MKNETTITDRSAGARIGGYRFRFADVKWAGEKKKGS